MRTATLIVMAVALSACAQPERSSPSENSSLDDSGAQTATVVSQDQILPVWGQYSAGPEAYSFTPCGERTAYWVDADSSVQAQLRVGYEGLAPAVYEPILIRVVATEEPRATDGFAADYDGMVNVRRVVEMRASKPGDCGTESGMSAVSTSQVPQATVEPSQEKHAIDQKAQNCMEAEGWSGQGVAICLNQSVRDWDDELNVQYRLLISRSEGAEDAVRDAQRAWIAHRDAEFAAIEGLFSGEQGSSWATQMMELRLNVVRARALQLAQINGIWT